MKDDFQKKQHEEDDVQFGSFRFVSRRYFLREALGATAGIVLAVGELSGCTSFLGNAQEIDGAPLVSGTKNVLPAKAAGHIERVSIDESACASCGMCSMVCAAVHGREIGPDFSGIHLDRKPFECEYTSITCHQCDAPECFFACEEGAFYIDEQTGARAIDREKCIGCGQCVEACVFDISRIRMDEVSGKAFKCDLCSGRPEGPACVELCPKQALHFVKRG